MKLLVTGGAGFIGSNFVDYWRRRYPLDGVVVLDALTYAGDRSRLALWDNTPGYRFVHGNVNDSALVAAILREEGIETIVHFAAESHVDKSISGPDVFIQSNVMGTHSLLSSFRSYWEERGKPSEFLFLHISTDEVYGSLSSSSAPFTEESPYLPSSPYSASKASADHFVRAYAQTYDLPTIVAHSSNNYGPNQFPEKLIPLVCQQILAGLPLPVYGRGENIRDWIFVLDHCKALDLLIRRGTRGETYNIGGNAEVRNIDLVSQLCELMDELATDLPVKPAKELIRFVADRPGHDFRYAIDTDKMKREFDWRPEMSFSDGLRETVIWHLNHRASK